MSLRTGCLSILFGLLTAVGLFVWSETEAGRPPLGRLGAAAPTASPRPARVGPTAAEEVIKNTGKRAIPQFVINGQWVQPYRPGEGFLYEEMKQLLGIDG